MKKIILGVLLTTLLLTGCGSKDVNLDLNKIKTQLSTLQSDKLDRLGSIENVLKTEVFNQLEDVYDFDYEKLFGLNKDNLVASTVQINKETKEMYAILLPKEGKKDSLTKEMKAYLDKEKLNEKCLITEIQGHLIYIVSKDNNKVLEAIKSSKEVVFGKMVEVTKEQMKDVLNLDAGSVDEFLMAMPMMMIQSNTYIIVKPVAGKTDDVKKALDAYMLKLEEQWKTYLPDQYELVKNRKVVTLGDYIIYIASSNNDLVYETIKNNQI
ncbi:MAG: DUF4358 domain-containing protein [Bacilli bacterium]